MRYAKGLAAFDELAPPTTFGPELKTQRANELTFGLSGNIDLPYGNMMLGALSRRFTDADESTDDPDDGWEYAVDARPLVRTLTAQDASVFQIAPMFVFSPLGPSSYDRPQIRVFYRGAHLDQGALDQYVPDDPRHAREWQHFIGFAAEWWFNSSTYH
jgi:maltoporin